MSVSRKLTRICRNSKKFIYNKQEKTFCRKTCVSWWRVIGVYTTYSIVVVSLAVLFMYGLSCHVKNHAESSLIEKTTLLPRNSPQLTIFPTLVQTDLVWYTTKSTDAKSVGPKYYIDYLDKYFKKYENLDPNKYVNCSTTAKVKGTYCMFNKQILGPCGKEGYGYLEDKPCIFLKMNKFLGWYPKQPRIDVTYPDDYGLPDQNSRRDMLREEVPDADRNAVLLTRCFGGTPFATEHIGEMQMYPPLGFRYFYFPYDGSKYYLAPLVAVQLLNILKGTIISITCSVSVPAPDATKPYKPNTATVYVFVDGK